MFNSNTQTGVSSVLHVLSIFCVFICSIPTRRQVGRPIYMYSPYFVFLYVQFQHAVMWDVRFICTRHILYVYMFYSNTPSSGTSGLHVLAILGIHHVCFYAEIYLIFILAFLVCEYGFVLCVVVIAYSTC